MSTTSTTALDWSSAADRQQIAAHLETQSNNLARALLRARPENKRTLIEEIARAGVRLAVITIADLRDKRFHATVMELEKMADFIEESAFAEPQISDEEKRQLFDMGRAQAESACAEDAHQLHLSGPFAGLSWIAALIRNADAKQAFYCGLGLGRSRHA